MTMIARVVDGLPLVGTMQEDEQVRNPFKKVSKTPKINKIGFDIILVWKECVGVSESSKNAVPQIGPKFTAKMFDRNWTLFISVSFNESFEIRLHLKDLKMNFLHSQLFDRKRCLLFGDV